MDATFVYMGYRGEQASRTQADSRRQSPWQSSSSTGPGSAASWDDGSRGYDGQDDGYAADDGYGGYPQDDPHAGHADLGQGDGYGTAGGYGATGGYGVTGTYSTGGYGDSGAPGYGQRDAYRYADDDAYPGANGYADANGYTAGDGYGSGYGQGQGQGQGQGDGYGSGYGQGQGQGDGYGHTGSYGQLSAYRDGGGGYGGDAYAGGGYGSRAYERPPAEAGRHSSGYDTGGYDTGGYDTGSHNTGGYDTGSHNTGGSGRHRDAGNDWYNGQPAASSGSGFADTGMHSLGAQAIESYGTSPRDPVRGFPPVPARPRAELEAGTPQGLVRTGQQERYDDTQYDAYPAYNEDAYDAPDSYATSGAYQASPGYRDYDEPQAFGATGYDTGQGYDTGPRRDAGRGYDDYEDEGDPYQERYRDDGPGRRHESTGGRKNKSAKRSKRPLLLSAMAVVLVGAVGATAYTFLKPKAPAGNPSSATGPLSTSGTSASAATAACVRQLGEYCHIELRTDDPAPLTLAELFPPAFTNETDHASFSRIGTRLDKACANAVIGQNLISALHSDACTQVLRASYVSDNAPIMGTIGVINLATTTEAHRAGKVVGANDFIAPLSTKTGIGKKLGSGTGVVEAEFKGHYLILTWAEFTDGKAPKTTAQDDQLEQFESDLVAGTANIYLSQRMVNGVKATAG